MFFCEVTACSKRLFVCIQALIGPPQAECHQTQHYHMYRGPLLVLETSQMMPNIPFGDHFTVEVRWDVRPVDHHPAQCHVTTHVSVPFSKSTWWKKVWHDATDAEVSSACACLACLICILLSLYISIPSFALLNFVYRNHCTSLNILNSMSDSFTKSLVHI